MIRLTLVFLLLALGLNAQIETPHQRLSRTLHHLASEHMQGRFPGTRQDTLAAEYIRNTLLEYGYHPLANEGLQSFYTALVRAQSSEQVPTFNVVMSLYGPVDSLAESIVIGAHYDHLGMGGQGSGSKKPNEHTVHYGADDNASGVAGVMEVARMLAVHKNDFRRNIVVAAFGAEEQGIAGAKEFVRNPVSGIGKPVIMFNLDMIGRMDSTAVLHIGGVGTFEGGDNFIDSLPNPHNFRLARSKDGYGPSDHAAFYGSGIPVLYFNTGVHTDYHSPTDHADKINIAQMSQICDYIFTAVYRMAIADQAPTFRKVDNAEAPPRPAAFNVSLGIIPDFSAIDSTGLRADFVTDGRPAEKAGMKAGDVIKYINGKEVFNVYDYMERLGELEAGELVEVKVLRNNELITLMIQL
ncbi:MAG: M20/M25/M40 family metallo-hydrolase [Bacteroidales bacterium]|nr:M20/M25/M40 family metallo-hydrolase [Bacteroidales bacterium]